MLPLDDPRWNELQHAYGSAADVPAILRELYSSPSESTWDEIWSCLCHQYTVYTATFAAVPHILAAARSRPIGSRVYHIAFLGTVASYKDDSCILEEFRAEYDASCPEAADIAIAEMGHPLAMREDAVYLLASLAGLCGCTALGRTLEGFSTDEFLIVCPKCGTDLYVWPDEGCYRIHADDPVANPSAPSTVVSRTTERIEPISITREMVRVDNVVQWISALATQSGHPDIGERAVQLFGRGTCPSCQASFEMRDQILSQAS